MLPAITASDDNLVSCLRASGLMCTSADACGGYNLHHRSPRSANLMNESDRTLEFDVLNPSWGGLQASGDYCRWTKQVRCQMLEAIRMSFDWLF